VSRKSGVICPENRGAGLSELRGVECPERASKEIGIGGRFLDKGPGRCQAGGCNNEALRGEPLLRYPSEDFLDKGLGRCQAGACNNEALRVEPLLWHPSKDFRGSYPRDGGNIDKRSELP
jgi:hypothetical protein